MLAIWSLVLLPFLNPAWTSGSSWFMLLKPGLENFEHYFASMWDECNCTVVSTFFDIVFFGIGINTCFSPVQLLSHVRLFVIPWSAACQASLSITISRSSLKPTSIELVMPSSHLILCYPLFLLPPIPPSISSILEPPKIKSVTVFIVSPSICHEVMGPDVMILFFEC